MHAVGNASVLFLDERGEGGGGGPAVVGVSMLGNRAVLLEVQVGGRDLMIDQAAYARPLYTQGMSVRSGPALPTLCNRHCAAGPTTRRRR